MEPEKEWPYFKWIAKKRYKWHQDIDIFLNPSSFGLSFVENLSPHPPPPFALYKGIEACLGLLLPSNIIVNSSHSILL